jgi:hypothetical protein
MPQLQTPDRDHRASSIPARRLLELSVSPSHPPKSQFQMQDTANSKQQTANSKQQHTRMPSPPHPHRLTAHRTITTHLARKQHRTKPNTLTRPRLILRKLPRHLIKPHPLPQLLNRLLLLRMFLALYTISPSPPLLPLPLHPAHPLPPNCEDLPVYAAH